MLLNKKDGTPFATERAAKMAANNSKIHGLKKDTYTIEAVEGGFSIKVDEPLTEEPTVDNPVEKAVETAPEKTVEFTGGWKDVKILEVIDKYKKPGRRYKWANTKIDSRIETLVAQGFVVDKDMYEDMKNLNTYKDNTTSLDCTTRVRELLLMWIPEAGANQRNRHFQAKARARLAKDREQLEAELLEGGGSMYGSLKVRREEEMRKHAN
jgi:hypothetical protein